MTRINATIPPKKLCDQHLLGEYKEILRVNSLAIKSFQRGDKNISNEFTLGTGHVKFFFNKLEYICDRFHLLKVEMEQRGYKTNITYERPNAPHLFNMWLGTESAKRIVIERILDRASTMKKLTYYGESITVDEYKVMLDI
jgi:deoxyribonuclease (pyrimidine dimer)